MKKKKKHPSTSRVPIEDRVGTSMYLRLCHRCLFLNEGSKHIDKCHKCESRFSEAPGFEKNFNPDAEDHDEGNSIQEALRDFDAEKKVEESDQEEDSEEDEESEEKKRDYQVQPISGLSVLW